MKTRRAAAVDRRDVQASVASEIEAIERIKDNTAADLYRLECGSFFSDLVVRLPRTIFDTDPPDGRPLGDGALRVMKALYLVIEVSGTPEKSEIPHRSDADWRGGSLGGQIRRRRMIAEQQRRALELHLASLHDELKRLPIQSPRRADLIRRIRDVEDNLDEHDIGMAT